MAIGGANYFIRNGIEVGKDILVAEESILTTPCQHVIEPVAHIRTSDTH